MARLPVVRKSIAYYLTQPAVRLLARTPIAPDAITWFGFVVVVGAAVLISLGHLFAAGFVVLIAGFLDILDGALARHTNRATPFGAILDATLDRLSEGALLLSLLVVYLREQSVTGILLVGVALVGSLLVSYLRAKAEALGLEGDTGIFTRGERVVVLVLGLWLSQINSALMIALAIITVFSFITVGQRLFSAWQQTKNS